MTDSSYIIFFGFLTSFAIVLLSTPSLIKVAFMKRLVDEPDDKRKLHARRVPTIGGIIIFAGTLFSYFFWYPYDETTEYMYLIRALNDFKYIGACMLILFFIGIKDDIIGTAPVKKLAGHLIVAFILVIKAEIKIESMHGLFGIYELDYWQSILLSVMTYTVIVNAFNLIDGVDGLASGIGTIVCVAYGIWFYLAGSYENSVLAFSLAGALAGFLWFNFQPAKIFMGDSGSLTIGLIVSILSIKLIEFDRELPESLMSVSTPVFAMSAVAYPLLDTLRIFTYRAAKGVSPFSADRNHIHHRLIDLGLGHRGTVLVIYLFNILVINLALFIHMDITYKVILLFMICGLLAQIPSVLVKWKSSKPSS